MVEIDTVLSQLDGATKARAHAEAKAEGMDDQIRRLKAQVDDLSRQNNDLSKFKSHVVSAGCAYLV